MKNIFLVGILTSSIALFGIGLAAEKAIATEKPITSSDFGADNTLSLGIGLSSDWGNLGASLDRRLSERGHIHGNFGIDLDGRVLGIGYKYQVSASESDESWFSQCLFLFRCTTRTLIGASFKHFSDLEVTKRSGNIDQARYSIGPKIGVGATLTLRNEFHSGFVWDFDISYRRFLTSPSVELISGVDRSDDRESFTKPNSDFGAGFAVGYFF